MEDYRSGGTPWFTVIDPDGNIVFADFRLDPARFLAALGAEDADLKTGLKIAVVAVSPPVT